MGKENSNLDRFRAEHGLGSLLKLVSNRQLCVIGHLRDSVL
jgi:hypothetical protein